MSMALEVVKLGFAVLDVSLYHISSKLDHRQCSYDVICILKDGGHGVAN